jgi:hypothetical protein
MDSPQASGPSEAGWRFTQWVQCPRAGELNPYAGAGLAEDGRSGRGRRAGDGDEVGQRLQGAGHDPVVDPYTAALAGQQARLVEHLEVVADGGLGEPERLGQVADAGLGALAGLDQAEQPQPGRVGERLEHAGELLGAIGRQRRLGKRLAAGKLVHALILTDIYICVYPDQT